jgi:hypothetical protein
METTPSFGITFNEDEWQSKTVDQKANENRNILLKVLDQLGELRSMAGNLTIVTDKKGPPTPEHINNISYVGFPPKSPGKNVVTQDSLTKRDWIKHLIKPEKGGGGKSTRKKKKTKQKQRRKRKRKTQKK